MSHKIEIAKIDKGSFIMGANINDQEAFDNEKPARRIKIQNSFEIGIYPVTQKLYYEIMRQKPSTTKKYAADFPVDNVSWYDAIEFCNRLNELSGLPKSYSINGKKVQEIENEGFRLPKEKEWEYACKAGSETPYFFGDNPKNLHAYAWFKENSKNKIQKVGLKKPNDFGLYDIIGNVWEWCFDSYKHDESFLDYKEKWSKLSDDAVSIYINKTKVLRGGAFDMPARMLRSTNRDVCGPNVRHLGNSFRIARTLYE